MRYRNRYTTNNVNICVNVSNNYDSDFGDAEDIFKFHEKIDDMSTDIKLLKNNMETLSSDSYFELKLHQFLSESQIEKIRSLTLRYDEIESLLNDTTSIINYKETEVYFVEYAEDENIIIKAEIDGVWHNLNDTTNIDNDTDTLYKIPIQGYVVGIELYTSNYGETRESLQGIKTSYDNESKITTIFMNKGDYDFIYRRRPNNKIHVYSLIISNK